MFKIQEGKLCVQNSCNLIQTPTIPLGFLCNLTCSVVSSPQFAPLSLYKNSLVQLPPAQESVNKITPLSNLCNDCSIKLQLKQKIRVYLILLGLRLSLPFLQLHFLLAFPLSATSIYWLNPIVRSSSSPKSVPHIKFANHQLLGYAQKININQLIPTRIFCKQLVKHLINEGPKNLRLLPLRRLLSDGANPVRIILIRVIDVASVHIVDERLNAIAASWRVWKNAVAERIHAQPCSEVLLCGGLHGAGLAVIRDGREQVSQRALGVSLVKLHLLLHLLWQLQALEDQAMHLHRAADTLALQLPPASMLQSMLALHALLSAFIPFLPTCRTCRTCWYIFLKEGGFFLVSSFSFSLPPSAVFYRVFWIPWEQSMNQQKSMEKVGWCVKLSCVGMGCLERVGLSFLMYGG